MPSSSPAPVRALLAAVALVAAPVAVGSGGWGPLAPAAAAAQQVPADQPAPAAGQAPAVGPAPAGAQAPGGQPASPSSLAPVEPPPPPVPVGGDRLGTRGVVVDGGPALPRVSAAGFLVADLTSGQVLAAKDPHGRYAPASTLKTLTALALIPRIEPDRKVTPTPEDVGVDGSRVGLVSTLAYPAEELFTALLVVSGNDAAGALATAVGGMPKAAELMNAEAERLQARDTRAVNTSGLDARGQVSSPYDLALIARAGMALPQFRAYVKVRRSSVDAPGDARIAIANHNRLLGSYPGAVGIKNGFTTAARASFVGAATRGGRTLVVTLLRADPGVHREAAALLDWGFAASAAGARPVGQLVEPLASGPGVPGGGPLERTLAGALAQDRGEPSALPPVALALPPQQQPVEEGGFPLGTLATVAGLAAGAVVLRRRQVVQRRRRRRAARRAAESEAASGRTGSGPPPVDLAAYRPSAAAAQHWTDRLDEGQRPSTERIARRA